MWRQRTIFLFIGLGIGIAAGWLLFFSEPPATPLEAKGALEELEEQLQSTRANFERLQPPNSAEENSLRRPETPPYGDHLEIADSLGVGPVTGEGDISRYLRSGDLVPLVENKFYTVMVLEHSAPFVTPAMKTLLDEIGQRFQASLGEHNLPTYRFTISSATRTADLQADLRVGNRNAAPRTSSHEYGMSVDVVNFRYAYAQTETDHLGVRDDELSRRINGQLAETFRAYGGLYWDHLFGLMTRVLGGLQREGRALVLLEAEQPVFHITVTQ